MKKSLVALAALAASTAFAQSSVTISGTIKGGVAQTKYSGATSGNGSNTAVSDGSSQFHIKGVEDLGQGLKAEFQIDTRFRIDDNGAAPTTSPLATGNTFIGVTGGFGTVRLGKMDTHYCLGSDSNGTRATALQASGCALLGYVNGNAAAQAVAAGTRSVNNIRFISPTFNGLTVQADYSTNPTGVEGAVGTTSGGNAQAIRATYTAGPLTTAVGHYNYKSEDQTSTAARTNQKSTNFMINYDLGMATVGLAYDNTSNGSAAASVAAFTETERTATSLPITIPVGAGTILFTYTKAGNSKTAGVVNANTSATLVSVGFDYALSKRTSMGVSYARLNNNTSGAYALYAQSSLNGTAVNATGQDASQVYVGLRHTF